jgi:Ca2+-binding RTX toxin-like protein
MPGNFFNSVVTRGAEFSTPGTGFRVSNDGVDNEFDSINPTYPAAFTTFSTPRLFSAFNSTIVDAHFFVAGTDSAATVKGFGAVFTDVDAVGSTWIDFYDAADKKLARLVAPTSAQGLSFAGAVFDTERVFRIQIAAGSAPLGPEVGVAGDVVVMDDFLYGLPQPREAEFCKNPVPTNDCIVNGARNQPCIGSDGDDQIRGSDGPNVIVGGAGNDEIRGGRGDDIICGGPGEDDIRGGSGNDLIGGEEDNDRLRGERGDDVVAGGPGDDDATGGVGDDVVVGNDGNDDLRGERGDDELDGGLGVYQLDGGKDTDTCTDPDGAALKDCE